MDKMQRARAEDFIARLGLTPREYEKKEHKGGYRLYVASSSKRPPRFGYVRLNVRGLHEGKLIVYANGDFRDPKNKFTAQPKNPKDAWYRFSPDDKDAMDYAVKVVKSAYTTSSRS
ncbi:MAG: hypothetical protein F4Y50_04710 [Dehalococcoidia bacterium]|nr:hypothetical protein [Dehalococcoidia bacterium]